MQRPFTPLSGHFRDYGANFDEVRQCTFT